MKQQEKKWYDATWNPVTGCLYDCEYCNARLIAERFGTRIASQLDENEQPANGKGWTIDTKQPGNPYPFLFEPTLHLYRLEELAKSKKPKTVYVCSMGDLFGEWVSDEWIKKVFGVCDLYPQNRYVFLTKNPHRYLELGENGIIREQSNMWYGTSISTPGRNFMYSNFLNSFINIEPVLKPFGESSNGLENINWVIIGAETGNRKEKVVPEMRWIEPIVRECVEKKVPVYMKDSLIPIVGEENMRREYPWQASD